MMKAWLRLLLVLITVGGGCSGLVALIPLFSGLLSQGLRHALVISIAFAVYLFLTRSGLLFVYNANLIRPMLFAFSLQIPLVDLPGFRYEVHSLLYGAVTLGQPRGSGMIGAYIEWSGNFGTHAELRIGGLPEGNWSVGANLTAMLIDLFLLMYVRRAGRSANESSPGALSV
jgi:hypothetical protein